MKKRPLTAHRLAAQQLTHGQYKDAASLVQYMGAMQAQDYSGAKWALGLRISGLADAMADDALADGTIIRTHVMRPTWHFVSPHDIRWMLQLTAHRIDMLAAYNNRRMELDTPLFNKCNKLLEKALRDGRQMDRLEIAALLQNSGIATDELRLVNILMRAETDMVICSGGRKGKQFTYALLDERAPASQSLKPADPLAELARRYFISHGPATLQDYTWWSGLTATDAKKGLEQVKSELLCEVINDKTYWMAENHKTPATSPNVLLLPAYDEYTVAYKDRSAMLDPAHNKDAKSGIFTSVLVIDGKIEGTWKRTIKASSVTVEIMPFAPLTKTHQQQAGTAAHYYCTFLGLKGNVVIK